ncbi:MAG: N-acetylmuramoyl-L-alanine amidase [Clostridiales bacterium]|nr:N-acetylmuramoyl-L-alanine amidase [Clostridiales bacterium]
MEFNRTTPPFPGMALRLGSRGANVTLMQEYLIALSKAFPVIPVIAADGVFGTRTENAVRAFQRQFGLVSDGVIGPVTWNAIVAQYNNMQTPPAPPPPVGPAYPGTPLRVGARGEDVVRMQQFLNVIAAVYPSIPTLVVDGAFGPRTEAAVRAFQQQFGLTADGIIGPITWNAIVAQYNKIHATAPGIVVLDPGHGGTDPGAVSGTRLEKNDNLYLALAVRQRLQALGQTVVMTRTADRFVSLAERSTISNENNADLLVSIHRNASTSPAANGVENLVQVGAGFIPVTYAQDMLQYIVDAGVQNNRGVLYQNLAVLRNARAPGMLLEMGFITNAEDNRLFDANFEAYASAIAQGVMHALKTTPLPSASYFNYTVQGGDSLWSIANRFGTTVAAITYLNSLTLSEVTAGQILRVPSVK